MTETGIVTLIGTGVAAATAIIVAVIQTKKAEPKKGERDNKTNSLEPSIPERSQPKSIENQPPQPSAAAIGAGVPSGVSHEQIAAILAQAPPMQHDRIQQGFIGAQVSWKARLRGTHQSGDKVTVFLDLAANPCCTLHCTSSPPDCEVLKFAQRNTLFVVTGDIKRVSEMNAQLEDCVFTLP